MHRSLIVIFTTLSLLGACERGDPPAADATEATPQAAVAASDNCAGLEAFAAMACANPDLKRMDDELNTMVARLAAHSGHAEAADVRAAQRKWQREARDPCMPLSPPKRVQCFAAAYTKRMNDVRDAL